MWYRNVRKTGPIIVITTLPPSATTLDADIFLRLWNKQKLTPTTARHLLKLEFDENDRQRMHALAEKNRDGGINPEELAELDHFIRVGMVLSILQSRARALLKHSSKTGNGRG